MGRGGRVLAICAAVFLVSASAADARSLYFGISANSRTAGTAAQDLAAETGTSRLREDLYWDLIEPVNDAWTWTKTDQLYLTAAERGLSVLPIPNTPPCWAVPAGTEPEACGDAMPVGNAEYAEFVSEIAKRYGPGGDFWDGHPEYSALAIPQVEIWNEPYLNSSMYEAGEEDRYASLYKAAVIAGRQANSATRYLLASTIDARTGPAPSDYVKWAETLVASEPTIGSYIDGLAVHPYPGSHKITYQPENGTDEAFVNVRKDYERWKALGINKPVWITEVGYSSCADSATHCVPGVTQAEREKNKAEYLAELLGALGKDEYAFVHAVYLYNLEQWTSASAPNAEKSHWYGIAYGPTNEHLPAWNSFTEAVETLEGIPEPNTVITGHVLSGNNATFTFTANDPTAVFHCQIDTQAWAPCASPKVYSSGMKGSHVFRVRAINAEAMETTPASYGW
jgi:hypothetical protein